MVDPFEARPESDDYIGTFERSGDDTVRLYRERDWDSEFSGPSHFPNSGYSEQESEGDDYSTTGGLDEDEHESDLTDSSIVDRAAHSQKRKKISETPDRDDRLPVKGDSPKSLKSLSEDSELSEGEFHPQITPDDISDEQYPVQRKAPDPSETTHTSTLNIEDSTLGRIHKNEVEEYIGHRSNPFATFVWFLVAAGFFALLGMQVKYFMVDKYAQDDRYRTYLAGFCRIAQCELPPRQNPYLLTLTHTKIDLHPTQPGALRVTVKMVNEAQFSQPYPMLQLTLTDRVGRIVGRRTFTPEAYLPKGVPDLIGEGELTSILFDLARPHDKAVGFVVDIVTEAANS
jgi:hypothetical protein